MHLKADVPGHSQNDIKHMPDFGQTRSETIFIDDTNAGTEVLMVMTDQRQWCARRIACIVCCTMHPLGVWHEIATCSTHILDVRIPFMQQLLESLNGIIENHRDDQAVAKRLLFTRGLLFWPIGKR